MSADLTEDRKMDIGGIGGVEVGRLSHRAGKALDAQHGVSSTRSKGHRHHSHEHGPRAEHHQRGRATNILRQEIREVFSASFRLSFSAALPAYASNAGDDSPTAVAGDTLSSAKQLVERSPLEASKTLISLRSKVEYAATNVREALGDDDHESVDQTMSQVSKGLDDLDKDAARNVASSASVLSVDTSLRQRSTIRIRTQEGDVVRLDLRRAERMSATDVAVTEGDKSASETRVEVSSRTRSVLKVKGDLNEAELAAIQNVFAQAEAIADEFFGGDLVAAVDMVAGMEFDADQLSKVNMRFRERQTSNISFAAVQSVSQQPAIESTPKVPASSAPVEPETPSVMPVATAVQAPEEPDTATPAVAPAVDDAAFDGLADLLSGFLRAANQAFESGSYRYHYSESIKLEILKSVLQVSAPEESGEAANTVAAMIDAVTASVDDD